MKVTGMSERPEFSAEQKQYLQGFVAGTDALRDRRGMPTFAATLGIAETALRPAASMAPGAWRILGPRWGRRYSSHGAGSLFGRRQEARARGASEARQESVRDVGRDACRGSRGSFSQGNGCLPLQISRPVFRRPGAERVHVPAAIARRHEQCPPAPRRGRHRRSAAARAMPT